MVPARSGKVLLRGGQDFIPRSEKSLSEAGIRIGQGLNSAGISWEIAQESPAGFMEITKIYAGY